MYLYSARNNNTNSGRPPKLATSTSSSIVSREIAQAAVVRQLHRDPTSASLNIKGPKQADALQVAEIYVLRKQLNQLPVLLKEQARVEYLMSQNNQRRNLQDFQAKMLLRLESLLRQRMIAAGEDVHKFHIGGNKDATYERFFRIEPARFMSKAQFTIAIRLIFGEELVQSSSVMDRLFDSFDHHRLDQMDWRAMLYLLAILMLPSLTCLDLIKLAYSLYSSVGSFDNSCSERLSVGVLRDLLATPVTLSLRSSLNIHFDQAWQHLMSTDQTIILFIGKAAAAGKSLADPDNVKVPFSFFLKLLTDPNSPFSQLLQVATVFGTRDPRPWSYKLEEQYYHPDLLARLKQLRRMRRNEDEAQEFSTHRDARRKNFAWLVWGQFVKRRTLLRFVMIAAEIRATMGNFGLFFDHWRKTCIEHHSAVACQRLLRGFTARRRRNFLRRMQRKVTQLQAGTRQLLVRRSFERQRMRYHWAAILLQRCFRGRLARRRVASIVEAFYDTQRRQLAKDRLAWELYRTVRATIAIQRSYKHYRRRLAVMRQLQQQEMNEQIEEEMAMVQEQARIGWEIYKQQLTQWYVDRKISYDEQVLNEQQTQAQKKAILDRRHLLATQLKAQKKREREELMQRIEEEEVDLWIRNWEEKIVQRGEQRRKTCRNALKLPENPEELALKKDLNKRIKANIKDVLRKADMQKIPMEMPEAFTVSTEEIIEEEAQLAMTQARQEMKEEGIRLTLEKEQRLEQQRSAEIAEKKRKAKWAVVTLQKHMRVFLARFFVRQQAYRRYKRLFDISFHEYFYLDVKNGEVSWSKPRVLGSYDAPMDSFWLLMPCRSSNDKTAADNDNISYSGAPAAYEGSFQSTFERFYFYHPATWRQQWTQPEGTVLCEACTAQFAYSYLHNDGRCLCDPCLASAAQSLIEEGQLSMKSIIFTPFDGGREDAQYMDLTVIHPKDWYSHIMTIDPSLRMSEEEEQEEERLSTLKQIKRRASQQMTICQDCQQQPASMLCRECASDQHLLCEACDRDTHKKGAKRLHHREKIFSSSGMLLDVPPMISNDDKKTSNNGMMSRLQSRLFGRPHDEGGEGDIDDDNNDEEDGRRKVSSSSHRSKSSRKNGSRRSSRKKRREEEDVNGGENSSLNVDGRLRLPAIAGAEPRPTSTETGDVSSSSSPSKHKKKMKRKKKTKSITENEMSGIDSNDQLPSPGVNKTKKKKRSKSSSRSKSRERRPHSAVDDNTLASLTSGLQDEVISSPVGDRKKEKNKPKKKDESSTIQMERSSTAPGNLQSTMTELSQLQESDYDNNGLHDSSIDGSQFLSGLSETEGASSASPSPDKQRRSKKKKKSKGKKNGNATVNQSDAEGGELSSSAANAITAKKTKIKKIENKEKRSTTTTSNTNPGDDKFLSSNGEEGDANNAPVKKKTNDLPKKKKKRQSLVDMLDSSMSEAEPNNSNATMSPSKEKNTRKKRVNSGNHGSESEVGSSTIAAKNNTTTSSIGSSDQNKVKSHEKKKKVSKLLLLTSEDTSNNPKKKPHKEKKKRYSGVLAGLDDGSNNESYQGESSGLEL